MIKLESMLIQSNRYETQSYSSIKSISLVLFYFIFVIYIFPYIASYLVYLNNPEALTLPLVYQFYIYFVSAICISLFSYKMLKSEFHLSSNKMAITVVSAISVLVVMNLAFSIIYEILGYSQESANQTGLETVAVENVALFVIMVCVLAPIIEEIIFRGVLFRWIRSKLGFVIAIFISSFAFGFIHIMNSFFAGDYIDCIYIFLYGGLGIVFCYAYEYNKSIYACILLHASYNFLGCLPIILS